MEINKIISLVNEGKIRWTNHVIMRLVQRNISQEDIENDLKTRKENN